MSALGRKWTSKLRARESLVISKNYSRLYYFLPPTDNIETYIRGKFEMPYDYTVEMQIRRATLKYGTVTRLMRILNDKKRFVAKLINAVLMIVFVTQSFAADKMKIRHGLQIEVDKSVGRITNITYTYGDEFVKATKPSAGVVVPMFVYISSMTVPEYFEISWETRDGKKHETKVPVKSQLNTTVEDKKIVFVIMPNDVEAFIATSTPFGEERERFF